MTATPILPAVANDPLLRPRTVIDAFDQQARATQQRAATENRLAPFAAYDTEIPERSSLIHVTGGALGFLSFIIAVPFIVTTYLARAHHGVFQLQGIMLPLLILGNIALAYVATLGHEALHALACRLLGGNPILNKVGEYGLAWSAPAQGFSRRSYLAVTLFPLVAGLLLFIIILVAFPNIAALLPAALAANIFLSAADLWIVRQVTQLPEAAIVFVDTHAGYVAYSMTAAKTGKKAGK